MEVVCIFPVTGRPQNIPVILEIFKKEIAPDLCVLGAIKPEIKFAGTDYIFVANNESLEGQPKGRGILDCLKNVSKLPDFVIVCDGSGKIPYKYIVDVFQELTSDSKTCCVMADRGEDKAISNFRYLIERFEIFALKKYHNHEKEIPDGQCGLWGFRKKLKYSFVNVKLPEIKAQTSFDYEQNIIKMKFLIEKYPKFRFWVPEAIDEFEKEEEFKGLMGEDEKEPWKKCKEDLLNIKTS